MSEHQEQACVIEWANLQSRTVPELALLFAIPNGGGRGKPFVTKKGVKRPPLNAVKLKAEGLKSGVPDLMLPVARGAWHGLFIEMKDGDSPNAKLSDNQWQWHKRLILEYYKVMTCWSATEAIEALQDYLNLRKQNEHNELSNAQAGQVRTSKEPTHRARSQAKSQTSDCARR